MLVRACFAVIKAYEDECYCSMFQYIVAKKKIYVTGCVQAVLVRACFAVIKAYEDECYCSMFQYIDAKKKIYVTGCVEAVLKKAEDNLYIVGGVALGVAVIQVSISSNTSLDAFYLFLINRFAKFFSKK